MMANLDVKIEKMHITIKYTIKFMNIGQNFTDILCIPTTDVFKSIWGSQADL